jgi:hypothetical protein
MRRCYGMYLDPSRPNRHAPGSSAIAGSVYETILSRPLMATFLAGLALCLLPVPVGSDDSGLGRRSAREDREGVRAAAQLIESARRSGHVLDDPFEKLALAVQSTRTALEGVASPRPGPRGVDAANLLTRRTSELRQSCDSLRGVATGESSRARVAAKLSDRCTRMLGGLEETLALPNPRAQSGRAAALLGELAAAGPDGLDARRAPPTPTMVGPE